MLDKTGKDTTATASISELLTKAVHPGRLPRLKSELPVHVVNKLASHPRIQQRLRDEVISPYLTHLPGLRDEQRLELAHLLRNGVERTIRDAGLCWHAHSIQEAMMGGLAPRLMAVLSHDEIKTSLSWKARAPKQNIQLLDDIENTVTQDGVRCVRAWMATYPGSMQAALELVLPPGSDSGSAIPDADLRIATVRHVLSRGAQN